MINSPLVQVRRGRINDQVTPEKKGWREIKKASLPRCLIDNLGDLAREEREPSEVFSPAIQLLPALDGLQKGLTLSLSIPQLTPK